MLFGVAAAESSDGIVWLGGSVGQLVWAPCRPIWSGSLQASVSRTSGPQDMLHWLSFLIQSQAEEDLLWGADSAHCLRQTPTEQEEFPHFLDSKRLNPLPTSQYSPGSL